VYSHLWILIKAGLGFVDTNVRIQWDPVYKAFSSNSSLWKRTKWFVVIETWSWRGKPVASARAGLREANAERWHLFFPYEIGMCSEYQNVEESRIEVCEWLRYLRRECVRTVPTFGLKTCLAAEFVRSRHCAAAFSLQVPKSCTDLDLTFLYISIPRTYIKFVRENKMLALGVCFPQPCSSNGRKFAASRLRFNYYRTIVSFPQEQIWSKAL